MEDLASAGMICTHWWKVAWWTFVSAKNGAQYTLMCLGGPGARDEVGFGLWDKSFL